MMIEQATVLSYQNGIATIQSYAKQGCGGCSVRTGCGTTALSALAGEKYAPQFQLAVPQPLQAGDQIEIGITEQHLLKGVLWLYVLPLFTLLVSALLFSPWLENELVLFVIMLASTAAVFRFIQKKMNQMHQAAFTPVFVRKL